MVFDEIYIFDLHGSTLKNERMADGSPDENVFDIQPGVSICLCVRKEGKNKLGTVRHSELWGTREEKYSFLNSSDVSNTLWEELAPDSPYYLFVPSDKKSEAEFSTYWSLTDIFPSNSAGIVTARDHFTIWFSAKELWHVITDFLKLSVEEAREKYSLRKDVRDWKVYLAQHDLRESGPTKDKIQPILYRAFDTRFTYF